MENSAPRSKQTLTDTRRKIYRALGGLFFGLGAVGIGVPLLPTVPFWILAAWFFARSSPQLRDRIYAHPTFGLQVRDFLEYGSLSKRGKIGAVTGMSTGVALTFWLAQPPLWVIAMVLATLLPVVIWLLTRPLSPEASG